MLARTHSAPAAPSGRTTNAGGKTRSAGSFVAAAEAVDRRKLGRLARLGAGWLAMRGERDARWRVVIAALTVGVDGTRVELIEAS